MTTEEAHAAALLVSCRFVPGSFDKRFARDLAAQAAADPPKITDRQAALLWTKAHRYRRQIGDPAIRRTAARLAAKPTAP